jgi:CRISPR-associated endonuclease Csn1
MKEASMAIAIHENWVLGLDIGTSSVGWALVEEQNGSPQSIKAAGARIFPTGVNIDPASGKNESRAVDRRAARQRRRMLDRRQMRKTSTARILRRAGLVPAGKPSYDKPEWKKVLTLDPYQVRVKALDQPLTAFEFGRAIFHLCQRRGFQTNRKAPPKKNERGEVKEATDRQAAEMQATGARTFGEYLFRLNPHELRRRERYSQRQWYKDEFAAIWKAQAGNHALQLTDELRKDLEKALFFQRPLRKQKASLLGHCELEPGKPRAATALLATQRFRLLQDLNHTRIVDEAGCERELKQEERQALLGELEKTASFKYTKARKLLQLPRGTRFNFEEGGREAFSGDSTCARIREVLGDRWSALSENERNQLVEDLMSIENQETMLRRAQRVWKLDEQEAEDLADIALEDGHASLSTKAIRRLLPHLEKGLSYTESVIKEYPARAQVPIVDCLPKLENLRNPMVQRALAELRRVINAVVREYGKPGRIRIELARDLKRNASQREETWKEMRLRERERQRVAARIVAEAGITQPKRYEIEKALLHEECCGICPYTGKGIAFQELFGDAPRFDVEHIIPFSRSLDDSFANKTLCEANFNRHIKRGKTPFEARGEHATEWNEILTHVRAFKGSYRDEKLRRFLLEKVDGEDTFAEKFSANQLNDTRYASRRARDYLAQLFPPEERLSRMQVSAGRTTAYLRNAWQLNGLLNDGAVKTRADHRHHAVDAIVIALTTPGATKALSVAAQHARRPGVFEDVPLPWRGFVEAVREALGKIVVSHRVSRRVNGPLHEETFYGVIRTGPGQSKAVIRKRIEDLSEADIKNDTIVDKAIREAVQAKLTELALPPAKAFQSRANRPQLKTKAGRAIPIKRVRIFKDGQPEPVGAEPHRFVFSGNNHHMEVFDVKDRKGNPSWKCEVVSLLDTKKRLKAGQPIIRSKDEAGNKLVFSLAIGDSVKIQWAGAEVHAVVQMLSDKDYSFRLHTDARMAKDGKEDRIRIRSDASFYATNCRKLSVDPLGGYHVSHD